MIDAPPRSGHVTPPLPDCWRVIGVSGDRSCPELERFVHCRNCPVLADAARVFFDRAAPPGYLESWREILEEPAMTVAGDATSVLVFRIAGEWLALPAAVLVEVTTVRAVHRVPHRTGGTLAGLVNVRGQLQLCMSMHVLLGLPGRPAEAGPAARLLVVERAGGGTSERWVLGVDEVAGMQRVPRAALRPLPATVGHAAAHCSSALFDWQERAVALLDEGPLFDALRDRVSP